MLGMALNSLKERASQRGLVLSIDDAHHLDGASLGLVIQAVAYGVATVVLTARSGDAMSPELVDLWTNGVIQRIDLEPLDSEASRELVQKALGEIDDALDEELWRLAAGNPLVLHEIVEGAAGHTLTTGADGRWTATGQLAASPRLGDLVVSRLTALPDDLREAMEVVALGSPLLVALLDQVAVNRGGLEERGLVAETESGREPMVVAAHPLYGEILKENLGPARQRAAYRRLVDAAIASDGAVDPLRAAVWQLESGTLVSPELGIQGAGAALVRHDPALAEAAGPCTAVGRPDGRFDPGARPQLSAAI